MPMNRDALKGLGEEILNVMYEAPDDMWTEWLRAPFEEAAGWGDIPLATALKEAGAKGNGLIPAIEYGHRLLVRDLLEMGASPTAKNANGDAPIHLAASLGHGLIVGNLLVEGAEVDEPDCKGRTPLHLASASGNDVGVRALLAAGACPRHRHGSTKFCALGFASWNGRVDVMKTLLGNGGDANARGSEGRGVLHHAEEKNQVDVIEYLAREAGVEVDWKADDGITPLHVAAIKGHLPAVNALVAEGADISLRTNGEYYVGYGPGFDDCSALDFAAHGGHMDILKALVGHGADVEDESISGSLTALHHATAGNKLEAMRFLLDEGADVNAGADQWWNPIHLAVEMKSEEAILALAQHGADFSAVNEDTYSPLTSAAEELDLGLAKMLLAAGANPNPPDESFPALQMAVTTDPRSEEMVKFLLQHGADVNATGYEGNTALHQAMRCSNVGIVHLLVEAGAAVDGYGGDGYPSPLHVACGYDSYVSSCDVVKALLGHGASVNLCDDEGNTPLHRASQHRAAKMVDLLLRSGADESIANDRGETPADQTKRMTSLHARYEESCKPVLRLLDGAPADRAWRRRGMLVLCRAFPDKARPSPEETRANLPRAAKRRAPFGGGGGEGAGGELAVATSGGSAFSRTMWGLVRMAEEGVFRNVISFL